MKWKPEYPNPAFDNMRPDDAFWAARIVSRFTDEMIGAVVREGAVHRSARDRLHDADADQAPRQGRGDLAQPGVPGRRSRCSAPTARSRSRTRRSPRGPPRPAESYQLQWFRFDNATATRTPVGRRQNRVGARRPSAGRPPRLRRIRGRRGHGASSPASGMGATGGVLLPPRRHGAGRWWASSADEEGMGRSDRRRDARDLARQRARRSSPPASRNAASARCRPASASASSVWNAGTSRSASNCGHAVSVGATKYPLRLPAAGSRGRARARRRHRDNHPS